MLLDLEKNLNLIYNLKDSEYNLKDNLYILLMEYYYFFWLHIINDI